MVGVQEVRLCQLVVRMRVLVGVVVQRRWVAGQLHRPTPVVVVGT